MKMTASRDRMLNSGTVKLPTILPQIIFNNRNDALKFGDARSIVSKLESGNLSEEDLEYMYKSICGYLENEVEKSLSIQ